MTYIDIMKECVMNAIDDTVKNYTKQKNKIEDELFIKELSLSVVDNTENLEAHITVTLGEITKTTNEKCKTQIN